MRAFQRNFYLLSTKIKIKCLMVIYLFIFIDRFTLRELRFTEIHFWMGGHKLAEHVLFLLFFGRGETHGFLSLIKPVILRCVREQTE